MNRCIYLYILESSCALRAHLILPTNRPMMQTPNFEQQIPESIRPIIRHRTASATQKNYWWPKLKMSPIKFNIRL